MAQVSRAIKRILLQACPARLRAHLLESRPNLRKAAPGGLRFVYSRYLGDLSVNIDTRYKVERIMWTGVYEPPLMRFLQSQNTHGWTCFDVGANVGAIALALAKFAGCSGKVYAFEPGPPNLERLRSNIALNPPLRQQIEIVAAGVGSAPGELWWAEEKGNPGNALLSAKGTHRVPVITIDDFVRERNIARIDFIKIDVEGMELDVMRGAATTLRNLRPLLYFETLPRYVNSAQGASFADLKKELGELGYGLHRIDADGALRPLKGGHGGYTVAVPGDPRTPAYSAFCFSGSPMGKAITCTISFARRSEIDILA
jgi:FkbM family methyltransferase